MQAHKANLIEEQILYPRKDQRLLPQKQKLCPSSPHPQCSHRLSQQEKPPL